MTHVKVEVALGDIDLSVDPSTYTWTDWTSYVEADGTAGVQYFRGYRDGSPDPAASEIRFRGKNATKRWSLNNPNNPEFGRIRKGRTMIRVSHDPGGAPVVLATAILTDSILGYTANGLYQWADVTAFGRIQREESDETAGRSPAFLQITSASNIVYYVPGEDPSGSTVLKSFVDGQGSVEAPDVNYAADSAFPGSSPLWTMGASSKVYAYVSAYAQPFPQSWQFSTALRIPTEPGAEELLITVIADGTSSIPFWNIYITPGSPASLRIAGHSGAGVDQLTGTRTVPFTVAADPTAAELFGVAVMLKLTVTQNGTGIDWELLVESTTESSGAGQSGSVATQTVGRVIGISAGFFGPLDGVTFGHWAISTGGSLDLVLWNGFKGDLTDTAWIRLGNFAGIPIDATSFDATSTIAAVEPERAIDTMKRVARSEGGLAYESVNGVLIFVARDDLYNQTVAMTINRNSQQIGNIDVIDDLLSAANRVTVTSRGAASATADAPSPNSPAEVGFTHTGSLDVTLDTDLQVREAAEWDVAVRSYQDYRYSILLRLMGPAIGLRSTFLSSITIGSRIQITNPQTGIVLDTIDQQVMGISGRLTEFEFDVTLNTRPAGPWQVYVVENGADNSSRLDTGGCVLLADLALAGTSAIVGIADTPSRPVAKWSTTSVPYDLALRTFDRVTCTAVANNPPTFVAAGVAAHADFATIAPALPAGMTAGDLTLCLASIRDSGFSNFDDPDGWTVLSRFGGAGRTFALYGRQYTSGLVAPSIFVSTGSAGDTVSGQTCGFRYAQPLVHASGIPLDNASAANIAYPGINVIRSGTVVLLIVQKDDDWTSLAAPGGFTKIGDPSSTLGNDQGIGWFYQIQTAPTDVVGGSIVVTGGAANTSMATMVALCGDAQTLTLTRGINGATSTPTHPTGSDVRLWRAGAMAR